MLSADGGASSVTEGCEPSSLQGCGLGTAGGYTLTIVGDNFGLSDQRVTFRGEPIDDDAVEFLDAFAAGAGGASMATFVVPPGVGKNIPVVVWVGGRSSAPYLFSYDPPYVTTVTPNEYDAHGDLLEIYGRNFGNTVDDAGPITVLVGNTTCGPVR